MTAVYIASPYGFSEATKRYYDAELLPAVARAGFEPLDPWADPDGQIALRFDDAEQLEGDARLEALREINADLAQANVDRIEACDAVLAILDGTDVDSGVAAEIGYAAARDKPIVGLRLDWRPAGDNAAALVNLQVEHFLTASARELDEALRLLSPASGSG